MGITSLMLLSTLSIFIYSELVNLKKTTLEDLSTLAELVGKSSSGALLFYDKKAASENLLALKATSHVMTAHLYTDKGEIFSHYSRLALTNDKPDHKDLPEKVKSLLEHRLDGYYYIDGNIQLIKRIILEQDKSLLGMIYLQADQEVYKQRVKDYIITIIFIISIALGLTLFFAFRVQKIFTDPILKLLASMQQVSTQHVYNSPVKNYYNDEFSQLINGYNEMLLQLDEHEKAAIDYQKNLEERVKTRTQQLQKARDYALSANRAKSTFLANMSHEIRTPMNAVLGYTQLLQRTSLDKQQSIHLSIIDKSGKHLLGLINDILELSKIESGSLRLQKSDFDLMDLAQNIEDMFKIRCEQKHIDWHMELYSQEAVWVKGDQGKIRQVLINLIGNACKFTEKGEVQLKIEQKKNNCYQFTVKDTGKGIEAAALPKIFDAFHQTELGEKNGGTGLGLNIAQRHIGLMSSHIQVSSEVERGSTFTFELELLAAIKPVKVDEQTYRPIYTLKSDKKLSALVVDDIKDNSELLAGILEQIGFSIIYAENGQLALDEIEKKCPDIVFMDIRMPVMDGIEAITKIRQKYSSEQLKCIAVSASNMQHKTEYYYEKGFDLFVSKPFNFDAIYYAISEILGVELQSYEIDNNASSVSQLKVVEKPSIKLEKNFAEQLKQAAEYGQLTELNKLLSKLSEYGQQGEQVAKHLQALINTADLNGILKYIEEFDID